MKPYHFDRVDNKHICTCCPGHDGHEAINKWVGEYRSKRSKRAASKAHRTQARHARRSRKLELARELCGDDHE